ncbi:MAG: hypothetical protein JSS48_00445 [Nitrospira sp.]|nr:hypothetical protein [Nitrospira sp.]
MWDPDSRPDLIVGQRWFATNDSNDWREVAWVDATQVGYLGPATSGVTQATIPAFWKWVDATRATTKERLIAASWAEEP